MKENGIFLGHCFVAPQCPASRRAESAFADDMSRLGSGVFARHPTVMTRFRTVFGRVTGVPPADVSFVPNVAAALNMIASGYPFSAGDEVVILADEYPSNVYPWMVQASRGVVLRVAPYDPRRSLPWGRAFLDQVTGPRTRIVSVSHVQFVSGLACDCAALGDYCRARGIDLVVDAAQSLGVLPVAPAEWGASAVAASGWKWLLGPLGSGVLYTEPAFRAKLAVTTAGPDMMTQGYDYLDHTFSPYDDGRRFEFSTLPYSLVAALTAAAEDTVGRYGAARIAAEVSSLHDAFLSVLDPRAGYEPLLPADLRGGILSLRPPPGAGDVAGRAAAAGVSVTLRGGILRVAPHFYQTEAEMVRAAAVLSDAARDAP